MIIKRFNNGNVSVKFDKQWDIKPYDKYYYIESFFNELEFSTMQSDYNGCYVFDWYTGNKYYIDYSLIDGYFDGKVIKLYPETIEQDDVDYMVDWCGYNRRDFDGYFIEQ